MKKYINAKDILPDRLIKEIQQYVKGQHIYIPQKERDAWGTSTGIREELEKRNAEIYCRHQEGFSIGQLAAMFNLSEERIRGIIYKRPPE
jgi:Mor family transcriptional regulator